MPKVVNNEEVRKSTPLVLTVTIQNSRDRKEYELKYTADELERCAGVDNIYTASARQICLFAVGKKRDFFTFNSKRYNIIKTKIQYKRLWVEYLKSSGQYMPKTHMYNIPQYPIRVYSRLQTRHMNHNVETITLVTEDSLTFREVEVNLFHCKDCDSYFINKEALDLHNKKHIYPVFLYRPCSEFDKRDFSPLFLYGYSVKQGLLREGQRHSLLKNIVENGLMSKMQIINFLQYLVNYNGLSEKNSQAAEKWDGDIRFVSTYTKDNRKMLNLREIPYSLCGLDMCR